LALALASVSASVSVRSRGLPGGARSRCSRFLARGGCQARVPSGPTMMRTSTLRAWGPGPGTAKGGQPRWSP
jgi:hypothetical protein